MVDRQIQRLLLTKLSQAQISYRPPEVLWPLESTFKSVADRLAGLEKRWLAGKVDDEQFYRLSPQLVTDAELAVQRYLASGRSKDRLRWTAGGGCAQVRQRKVQIGKRVPPTDKRCSPPGIVREKGQPVGITLLVSFATSLPRTPAEVTRTTVSPFSSTSSDTGNRSSFPLRTSQTRTCPILVPGARDAAAVSGV
jgi:hypothetical protein